jgi:hypothetical protein
MLVLAMLGITEHAFRGRWSAFPKRSTSPATTSGGSPPSSDWWSIRACSRREKLDAHLAEAAAVAATRGRPASPRYRAVRS